MLWGAIRRLTRCHYVTIPGLESDVMAYVDHEFHVVGRVLIVVWPFH